MKRYIRTLLVAMLAPAMLTGCAGMKPPTAAQCSALLVASQDALLVAKCAQAPDALKDASCITISTLNTAYALCLSQVQPPTP